MAQQTATGERAWDGEVASTGGSVQEQMARVFGFTKGLHATHLIDVGVKLGLLTHIDGSPGGMEAGAIAIALGLHARYVRVWCDAACALEILDYGVGGYRLAPGMSEVLGNPASPFYLGSFPSGHLVLARDYRRYPELFRTGETHPYGEHDEVFVEAVAEATKVLPPMFAAGVLPQMPGIGALLESGAAVLDVGCGAGYAVVDFAERYHKVKCTGLDMDAVSIKMAHELITERGLEDRVAVRVADASSLPRDLEGQFDMVTMFLVLHEIEPDQKAAVLAGCRNALRPGGRLLIFDERYPSSPQELRDPSQVFAVMAQWYEMTWGNEFGNRGDILALIGDAGFSVDAQLDFSRFFVVEASAS